MYLDKQCTLTSLILSIEVVKLYPEVRPKLVPIKGVPITKIALSSCGANTPRRGYFKEIVQIAME